MHPKALLFAGLYAIPLLVLYEVVGRNLEGNTKWVVRFLITAGYLFIVFNLNDRFMGSSDVD